MNETNEINAGSSSWLYADLPPVHHPEERKEAVGVAVR